MQDKKSKHKKNSSKRRRKDNSSESDWGKLPVCVRWFLPALSCVKDLQPSRLQILDTVQPWYGDDAAMPKHALDFVSDNQSLTLLSSPSRSISHNTYPAWSQYWAELSPLCRYLRLHFDGTHVQQPIIDVGNTSWQIIATQLAKWECLWYTLILPAEAYRCWYACKTVIQQAGCGRPHTGLTTSRSMSFCVSDTAIFLHVGWETTLKC